MARPEARPGHVALCACGHQFSDHSWGDFRWRECLVEYKPHVACACKMYDGKGKLVAIKPKKKYDGDTHYKPKLEVTPDERNGSPSPTPDSPG